MTTPSRCSTASTTPEESDATRAINAAASVLLAFFDAAAHEITGRMLGPRPALVEAYRRHRRSDARGEDAAAALFGISTQGAHHDRPTTFVAPRATAHASASSTHCCASTAYRVPRNSTTRQRGTSA